MKIEQIGDENGDMLYGIEIEYKTKKGKLISGLIEFNQFQLSKDGLYLLVYKNLEWRGAFPVDEIENIDVLF